MDSFLLPVTAINSNGLSDLTLSSTQKAEKTLENTFLQVITEIEQTEKNLGVMLTDLATGKADNLHQVMIEIEQSRLKFELFLQVRNRALEAYQELSRIQI